MGLVDVNGGVHTAHKQHQRKNIRICVRIASRVLCGLGLKSGTHLFHTTPLQYTDRALLLFVVTESGTRARVLHRTGPAPPHCAVTGTIVHCCRVGDAAGAGGAAGRHVRRAGHEPVRAGRTARRVARGSRARHRPQGPGTTHTAPADHRE